MFTIVFLSIFVGSGMLGESKIPDVDSFVIRYNKGEFKEAEQICLNNIEKTSPNPTWLYNLGECYYNGIGVNQDYKEAVACYKKAGEQGDSKAQYILGNCYYYGIGVEQNYYDAADWYQKAANGGFVKALGE